MYPEPTVHRQLAADRVERLRADYAAAMRRPRPARLRRRVGLGLVSLGLRIAGWPRTASEAGLHGSRA